MGLRGKGGEVTRGAHRGDGIASCMPARRVHDVVQITLPLLHQLMGRGDVPDQVVLHLGENHR